MNILKEITPSNKEIELNKKLLKSFISKFKLKDIKLTPGGSYAKNTWISGNIDIDIFAKFNYKKYENKDISKDLKKILLKKFKRVKTIHGSRDYFHIKQKNIIFEVVPVLDIENPSKAKNVMDVSPLHVNYVKKHTNKKLQDQIRILKQFCKANELYGAESYIKGFSGYVLEILIIYYKSFKNLLTAAKRWKSKTIIDPSKFYKSKEELLSLLNKSKAESPLILIDPVQPNRNAAAALGKEKFQKLLELAKIYDNSESFFKKKEVDIKKLKGYLIFKVEPKGGKSDIIGAKLLTSLERMKKEFEQKDFEVQDYGWKWNKEAYFWFKIPKLSKTKKHYGPELKRKMHVRAFKQRWKRTKTEKGIIYTIIKREFTDPKQFSKVLIKKDFIKEKLRKISLI
ncbi:MAG: nucleotidyltransferase domain-containing protein [Candidatus Woesearchaeota archaeon]